MLKSALNSFKKSLDLEIKTLIDNPAHQPIPCEHKWNSLHQSHFFSSLRVSFPLPLKAHYRESKGTRLPKRINTPFKNSSYFGEVKKRRAGKRKYTAIWLNYHVAYVVQGVA